MTDCVIQQVRSGFRTNPHIAEITGREDVPKPVCYHHTETGDEFSHIAGGIAFPTPYAPGFAVVVGVDRVDVGEPCMRVLDEAECSTVDGLLSECLNLRRRYGYPEYPGILELWIGDRERFQTLIGEFNFQCDRRGHDGVYVSPPTDYQRPDRFEIFMRRLQETLSNDTKRLYLGKSTKLQNYLQNLPKEGLADPERFPALDALGGLVHTLMSSKPWLCSISSAKEQTFETVATQSAAEAWDSLSDEEETDEYDQQNLIYTILGD